MKKTLTPLGLAACSVSALLTSCNTQPATITPPNVIYILADDMGYGDIKALNPESKIPTPALDKMVAQGISFSDAHSNSAVSTPTRYGTLTGRYAFRSRLKDGVLIGHDKSLIEEGRETVGSFLQSNGYNTACIGKWHLGLDWARKDESKPLFEGNSWDIRNTENVDYTKPVKGGPADHGFSYSYIIPASLDIAPYMYIENGEVNAPVTRHCEDWKSTEARGMWYRHGDIADNFKHETCLQDLTQKSVKYIEDQAKEDKPFFLFFPLTAPHTPWLPAEEFRGKSGAGVYGDFVCMVDDVVRRIYDALEKTGQAENTIVLFTSDNGSNWFAEDIEKFGHRANGKFSGQKSDIWEGGHRMPFVVTWADKLKGGTASDQLVCSTDLLATCAEMLNKDLKEDAGEDSFSFWSILSGKKSEKPMRESVIYHSIDGYFGFRQGDYALLDCQGSGGWTLPEKQAKDLPKSQLYNLKEDIAEKNNLIDSLSDKAKEMHEKLQNQIEAGRTR